MAADQMAGESGLHLLRAVALRFPGPCREGGVSETDHRVRRVLSGPVLSLEGPQRTVLRRT